MKKHISILLTVLVFTVGCDIVSPRQQPRSIDVTPSPTTQPSTAALTSTSTPSPSPWPSPTPRPSSTPKPSPTNTIEVLPSATATAESTVTPQTTQLADGSLLLNFGALDVIGTQDFIDKTSLALTLLQDTSPDAYLKIQTYVGLIKQGDHSGMWAFENPPRYEVGERTADASTTWYASTIAHDATHSELYHEYLAQNGSPVPDDAWASVAAEQFCIAYQLKVLEEVGGTESEIEYLEAQTGTHCDVDNDGDCDWNDYENRDW